LNGLTTQDALALVMPHVAGHVTICANGFISRAACAADDKKASFYMIGSMGLAAPIGLGIALAQPERRIAILDGDGNVLMNLGELATIASRAPAGFLHIVIDNGVYASTGDQPTISREVAIEDVARACGYREALRVRDRAGIEVELPRLAAAEGPVMLLIETQPDPGSPAPRVAHTPAEMVARLRDALGVDG
jgi:sulfopyruvate decarboxylase subunit beta